MRTAFAMWGNSLAVRLPKPIIDLIGVRDGTQVEISVENDAVVLRPVRKRTRRRRHTLEQLLEGMIKDDVPEEVDWGPAAGDESW